MNKKELNEEFLTKKIVSLFDKFDENRSAQLADINAVREAVYGRRDMHRNNWRSAIELPDIYECAQTLKAYIIQSVYSDPEAMFDVSSVPKEPAQEEKEEYLPLKPLSSKEKIEPSKAEIQKQMLVEAFEKMNFSAEIEKIVNDIVETGESVLFVGWERRYKRIRCAIQNINENEECLKDPENKEYFKYIEKCIFDGAVVKAISPLDFVFDVSRRENWESCPKIFRKYVDLQTLKSDPLNSLLTPLKAAQLRDLAGKENNKNGVKNGQLEVLEFWGDIALENGEILKNVLIVVAGRRFVIRAEVNPFVNAPFIYANIIEDPYTGRGLSPLRVAIPLNKISSTILNKQLDALSLIMNPPYLAPKGAFKGVQEVEPGKIIEYDASLLPQSPVALNFERALCGWDFIKYFKSGIESATGIFKTMAGDIAPSVRTATELNYSLGGQSTRLNLIIENINRKIIVPMVEKTAQTIANFKVGTEIVFVHKDGVKYACKADDELRCADFTYRYGDAGALLERKNKFKELYEVIAGFAGVEELYGRIDWLECFRFALEQYGIKNAANFLKLD